MLFKRLENNNQSTVYYGLSRTDQRKEDFYRIEDSLLIRSAKDTELLLSDGAIGNSPGAASYQSNQSMRAMSDRFAKKTVL